MGEQLPLVVGLAAAAAVVVLLAGYALRRRARRGRGASQAAAASVDARAQDASAVTGAAGVPAPDQPAGSGPAGVGAAATSPAQATVREQPLPAGEQPPPAGVQPVPGVPSSLASGGALVAASVVAPIPTAGAPVVRPAVVLTSSVAEASIDRPSRSISLPDPTATGGAQERVSSDRPEGMGSTRSAIREVDAFERAGLLARDAWARAYAIEERRHARYGRPCAVVAVALDGLEALSLRIGPAGAERLIGPLVETLAGRGRSADLVCRVDRTRFVALLPETDEAGASAYAGRVREACEPWLDAAPVPVRLSLGWAIPAPGGTMASALVAAERRMSTDRARPVGSSAAATSESAGHRRARLRALARSGVGASD